VFFSAGEGEEDGEDGGGEVKVVFGVFRHASEYISVADISATDILDLQVADGRDGPGLKYSLG
jgi:hypothetical protein